MFKLITIIFSLWSIGSWAGVGGIDGGTVHFQKDSTWVNMVFSKTLCYQKEVDVYTATGRKCIKWDRSNDDRRCEEWEPKTMVQPRKSTRLRCDKRDSDDNCIKWVTVDYLQKRDRIVRFKDEDGRVLKTEKLRVKSCN